MSNILHGAASSASDIELLSNQLVSQIAMILNECLSVLDQLGLSHAAAQLSFAVETLPGQKARPPMDVLQLLERSA